MSERGSPTDHTDTGTDQPFVEGQASSSTDAPDLQDGQDAKDTSDGSSPAAGARKEEAPKPTLADVVKTAAEKPDPSGKSPTPAKAGPEKIELVDPAKSKPAEQDDSKLSFHNHPRWHEVKAQVRTLQGQVENLTLDADQFRKIDGFMREHKLTPEEVGEGFIIMAMAKNGDSRVLQKLDEFRSRVALAIGEALPPDIQAKVESGEMSEAAAKDLAKARASATVSERRIAEREAADINARAVQAETNLRNAQAATVTGWEIEQRKLDPDFAAKENAVARYARALMQEHGDPRTVEQAMALVKMAYDQVSRDFRAAIPQRAPVRRAPIASSSNGAQPPPKTLLEAITRAAER